MLNLINKIYRKDKVTLDLINALKIKLTSVENKINDLYKQIFLDYATWYLEIKESEMGLNKKLDDLDKRRAYVRTRLLGTGTATKALLESTANTVPGVKVEIEFDNMTVILNFLKVENNKFLGIVKRSVENMLPYHLDLMMKYDHVNWGEIKGVAWNDTLTYTWGSVSQSVSNPLYEFAGIYADEGITATNTKKRDNFNRMIADCRNGKIDRIITKSISRFARNTLDCLNYVRELKALGIGITFEKEGINTLESSGEVLLTILSSLAQDESRSISENTRWGIRRRYENGEYGISTKRFMGYDRGEDGKLVINRKQAKAIKRIYEEYLSGKTVDYIKRILERDKIPKWDGSYKWQATTIQSILTNEKYKGDAELQKGHTVDFLTKTRKKNEGELQKFYIEEDHEAIISPEIWECVQLEMERRKQYIKDHFLYAYSSKTEKNPFFGKILCGECGKVFGRKTWSNKSTLRKVWQCNGRYEVKGVQGCNNRHIEESALEQIFIIAWNTIIENIESCRAKWKAQENSDDLLTAYRAKDFLKLTENAESINKVDTDFMIRVLDNITIYESGDIIISFYDGTKIEYT